MAETGFLDRVADGSKCAFRCGEAELTLPPAVGHNSWDYAYNEPQLPERFLRHDL